MKIKKLDIFLCCLLIVTSVILFLVINSINIIQFIAFSMVASVLWSWIIGHVSANSTKSNKTIKAIIIIMASLLFVVIFYGFVWNHIPMNVIENNTHFGPTESITFNSHINIGTYLANFVQQLVITLVFYFISKYILRLKN